MRPTTGWAASPRGGAEACDQSLLSSVIPMLPGRVPFTRGASSRKGWRRPWRGPCIRGAAQGGNTLKQISNLDVDELARVMGGEQNRTEPLSDNACRRLLAVAGSHLRGAS